MKCTMCGQYQANHSVYDRDDERAELLCCYCNVLMGHLPEHCATCQTAYAVDEAAQDRN